MKRIMSVRTVIVLAIVFFLSFNYFLNTSTSTPAHDGTTTCRSVIHVGPGQIYTSIQEAIDNASSGDTIYVENGTYYENIVIPPSMTLSIYGNISKKPIIFGNGTAPGISVFGDSCSLYAINITCMWKNNISGLFIDSEYNHIDHCEVYGYNVAVYLNQSHNSLSNNSLISDEHDLVHSDDLIGYWKMDENTWNGIPGEVRDSSKYGNNGVTKNGLAVGTNGKYSRCGQFDGFNDYIEIENESCFDLDQFTIMGWFNKDSLTYPHAKTILSKSATGGDKFHLILITIISTGVLRAKMGDGNSLIYVDSVQTLQAHTWYHFSVVLSETTFSLYINGKMDAQISRTIDPIDNTAPLRVGWNPNYMSGYCFSGSIDHVKVYKNALLNRDISTNYRNELSCGCYVFSNSNTFINNTITGFCDYAYRLADSSSSNTLLHNTLLHNNPGSCQVLDNGVSNSWNSPSGGNLWSDWHSPDRDSAPGIVDVPYQIDGASGASDQK
ncbi:MAG: LamG-like jellyroll fold domain-containing protein, partial [Methanosarcinaceae archaeon]